MTLSITLPFPAALYADISGAGTVTCKGNVIASHPGGERAR